MPLLSCPADEVKLLLKGWAQISPLDGEDPRGIWEAHLKISIANETRGGDFWERFLSLLEET